jgi:hypothetical protein
MLKLVLALALLAVSVSSLEAGEPPRKGEKIEKRESGELRRDIDRISKEIYRPRQERRR